jgi:hypothetical protein
MRQSIRAMLTRFGEGGDIAAIRFDAPAPVSVHRSVIRVGHDHVVAELFKILRDPLTFRRRLHENTQPRSSPKDVGEPFACRGDPLIDQVASRRHNASLTFFLVEVDGTILHGWSPLLRLERVFAMWSGSYHVTKEASRFILSSGAPPRLDHRVREPQFGERQHAAQHARGDQLVDVGIHVLDVAVRQHDGRHS